MDETNNTVKESLRSLHAALSTFVRWCLLPGIVTHELSHATACRLLNIEMTGITLFERSDGVTSPKLRAGVVNYERSESSWQSVLVSVAPLVGNTLGAIGAFTLVRALLREGDFATLGVGQQVLVGAGIWCGVALALTSFPSEPDLRGFGRYIGLDTSSKFPSILHGQMQRLLALLYALVLILCSLFGVQQGLRLLVMEYIGFPVAVLLVGIWNVIRIRSGRFPLPLTAVERRVSRLSSQIDTGTLLLDEDIQYLVDNLRDTAPMVCEEAAKTLVTIAARRPEQIAPYVDELLTVAEATPNPVVRQALLATLSNAREHVKNYDRLAAVGVAALHADATPVRDAAPRLLLGVALDEPKVLDESVSDIEAALSGVSTAERGDLVLALTLVEIDGMSSPTDSDISEFPGVDTNSSSIGIKEQLLRSLPPDSRDTVAILAESLEDVPETRPRTVTGFRKLGEAYPVAQPAIAILLIAYVDDTDPETRANVAMALRRFAEVSPATVGPHRAALGTALSDSDPRVRDHITGTLGLLVEQYPDIVEMYADECCALLKGDEYKVRKTAAWTLTKFAETSPSTLESRTNQIVAQLIDPHDDVREFTVQTLAAIAVVSSERVAPHAEVLQGHLTDPAPDVRMWVSVIFARLVESHPTTVAPASDALVRLLTTNDGVVRHDVLMVLGGVSDVESSSVEAGVDFVINRLRSGEQDQSTAAARTLAALVSYAPTVLESRHPELVDALGDHGAHVQAALLDSTSAASWSMERSTTLSR